jgi:hypothetical protein
MPRKEIREIRESGQSRPVASVAMLARSRRSAPRCAREPSPISLNSLCNREMADFLTPRKRSTRRADVYCPGFAGSLDGGTILFSRM